MNSRARALGLLGGAGVVLTAACLELARVENLVLAPRTFLTLFTMAFIAYAAGAIASARLTGPGPAGLVLAVGITCRLILLPTAPSLSTDAYRYVWDARVASAGVDPYAYPPTAPELAGLRDGQIYPRLNHKTWLTVYPPVAEAIFRAVYRIAPDSVLATKGALGLAEFGALAGVALWLRTLGLPLGRLTIYAWNPLVLVEIWGSGHLDGFVLLAVVAAALASARGRDGLAAVFLALGTLVKLYPVVLLPLLPGRRRPGVLALFAAVIVVGTLVPGGPDRWPVGPIGHYVADEYFNPGLVRSLVNEPVLALAATVAWVLVVAGLKGGRSMAAQAVPMVAGVILLAPNVFPWYAVWLVPFLTIVPSVPWIAFTGTVVFSYAFFLSDPWAIPWWARMVEVAPVAVGAVVALRAAIGQGGAVPGGSPPPRHELQGRRRMKAVLIVPALNEAAVVGDLVRRVPRDAVEEVIVVDNNSTDATAEVAGAAGARVVRETRRGYGSACFAGVSALPPDVEVAVFLDGDGSQHPEEIPLVLDPVRAGLADLVLGGRTLVGRHPLHARAGTRLLARYVAWRWGVPVTDLGPLRAIRTDLLRSLDLRDRAFGWPVEMVVKAAVRGARIRQVPVSHGARLGGRSKVSGTFLGSLRAGYGFLLAALRAEREGRAPRS